MPQALSAAGTTLLIKGRPVQELPRAVLPCFKYSIIDLADDRRVGEGAMPPPGVIRTISHVQSGVRTMAEMEASFERGAHAVLGWPIDDAINAAKGSKKTAQGDLHVIVELIRRVADAAQGDLVDGTHPLSDVFFAGHHVITRLREIHESATGPSA